MTAQPKVARSNTGAMGSNPNRGMDICVRLFGVSVVLCVGSGLATGWSPAQGVLPTVCKIKELKWNEAFHGYPVLQVGAVGNYEWMSEWMMFVAKLDTLLWILYWITWGWNSSLLHRLKIVFLL
jgi:hypothetical protein